ncbi:MAG: hypothetical protein NZ822_01370 [Patescibacteria group bacterium]|nr:hypothetical protein [Patescibacteria group bacterium]
MTLIVFILHSPKFILASQSKDIVTKGIKNSLCDDFIKNLGMITSADEGFEDLTYNLTTTLKNGIPEEILNFPRDLLINNLNEQNALIIQKMPENDLQDLIKKSIYVGSKNPIYDDSNFRKAVLEIFEKIKKK